MASWEGTHCQRMEERNHIASMQITKGKGKSLNPQRGTKFLAKDWISCILLYKTTQIESGTQMMMAAEVKASAGKVNGWKPEVSGDYEAIQKQLFHGCQPQWMAIKGVGAIVVRVLLIII